jgi:hypothetical protein
MKMIVVIGLLYRNIVSPINYGKVKCIDGGKSNRLRKKEKQTNGPVV